ncbi:MAG TPA: response regulator [Alphaproteobacteria bacterium]|nr:response regulator [Alphaproteobacteria bacterium]
MSATVLVAEDDPFIRLVIVEYLREGGFDVIEAANADEAALIFRSGTPVDLLFTDVRMPGSMDGCDLARLVRAEWPDTRVIITSGYSSALATARTAADDIVVPKPYRPHLVLETIAQMVRGPSDPQPC